MIKATRRYIGTRVVRMRDRLGGTVIRVDPTTGTIQVAWDGMGLDWVSCDLVREPNVLDVCS